jgi:hypothetical protein
MARHVRWFGGVAWEISIQQLPDRLDVSAQNHVPTEARAALPTLDNEGELLQSICRHLERTEGTMTETQPLAN